MTSQPSAANQAPQPQKMCKGCFDVIHPQAEICPKCGVRQFHPLNKTALLLITFFLGGIGAHKFYLGKHVQGVFYVLFCLTGIPSLIAFVEFLVYAFTDSEKLQRRYPDTHGSTAGVIIACVAGAMGIMAIIGILAAIAIPQFAAYRQKAACSVVETQARITSMAVSQYFLDHEQDQVPGVDELVNNVAGFSPDEKVALEVSGTREHFTVQASDNSNQCKAGQVYILNEPEDMGSNGWQ